MSTGKAAKASIADHRAGMKIIERMHRTDSRGPIARIFEQRGTGSEHDFKEAAKELDGIIQKVNAVHGQRGGSVVLLFHGVSRKDLFDLRMEFEKAIDLLRGATPLYRDSTYGNSTSIARRGNARRGTVTPDTTVYSSSAWWSESDPSMSVVALTAKRAETEIRKQMREAAKSGYDDDSYGSVREAMDAIRWSGVHSFSLRTLANERELEEAISDLQDRGVWYPPNP